MTPASSHARGSTFQGRLSEPQVRRLARTLGYQLRRSRSRTPEVPGFGGYMLVDPFLNAIVSGAHPFAYSLTLVEAAEELRVFAISKAIDPEGH